MPPAPESALDMEPVTGLPPSSEVMGIPIPSARVFWLLAFTTVLGVVGVLVPAMAWGALACDGLVVLAFFVDHRRSSGASLAARRTWPSMLVQGGQSEVRLDLSGPGPVHLRLWEGLHPGLAAAPVRRDLDLDSEGRGALVYGLRPRLRGEHRCGPLVARVLGPWGLAWSQRRLLAPETCRVVPQVRWDGAVGQLLLLAHRRSLGRHPQRFRGLGSEPYALREYLPGDPLNRIHWKATARHGRPVSREDTWELGARLLILLDCGRAMSGLDGERSKLDHALAAALALSRVAVARGDRVTLVAFSDRVERTVRLKGGAKSIQAAYARLFDLEARLAEPAYDVAAEAVAGLESRRSTVVLFTSVIDLAAADLLRRSMLQLERHHRPILVNLHDPELLALATEPPSDPAGAFAQVTSLEILLANRRLGKRLRHVGIRVVGTSADRLALETLEAYLAMFH